MWEINEVSKGLFSVTHGTVMLTMAYMPEVIKNHQPECTMYTCAGAQYRPIDLPSGLGRTYREHLRDATEALKAHVAHKTKTAT